MKHPDARDATHKGNAFATIALVAIAATLGYSLGWQRGIGPPRVRLEPLPDPESYFVMRESADRPRDDGGVGDAERCEEPRRFAKR